MTGTAAAVLLIVIAAVFAGMAYIVGYDSGKREEQRVMRKIVRRWTFELPDGRAVVNESYLAAAIARRLEMPGGDSLPETEGEPDAEVREIFEC